MEKEFQCKQSDFPQKNARRYAALAEASNGRLYAVPDNASHVLEIDPSAGTTRFVGDALPGDEKYVAVLAAGNGRLYAVPGNASHVLEIDPAAGTTDRFGAELPATRHKCAAAVEASGAPTFA